MKAAIRNAVTHGHSRAGRQTVILLCFSAAIILAAIAALVIGAIPTELSDFFTNSDDRALERVVLLEIRSPRVLLAALVGAALSVVGASLQGMFRNPLADPGLIGVSSGAAVGALAMIVLGTGLAVADRWLPYLVPLSAIAGASLVTMFLYAFSRRYGNFNVTTMLLAGIALNALATVAIGAFEYISDDRQLRTLIFWLMGSFGRATWSAVLPTLVVISASVVMILRLARPLDVLQLGEADAKYLGVDITRLKKQIIILAAAAVGAGVAVSGIITFVGLVVPHLVRLLGGASHRFVLPGSVLLGGMLAIVADVFARTTIVPAELPVGLVTSAMGAPFFLWLIARRKPQ